MTPPHIHIHTPQTHPSNAHHIHTHTRSPNYKKSSHGAREMAQQSEELVAVAEDQSLVPSTHVG